MSAERFALVYTVLNKKTLESQLECKILDARGAIVAYRDFPNTHFSASSLPIFYQDQLIWIGSGSAKNVDASYYFYSIGLQSPQTPTMPTLTDTISPTKPQSTQTGTSRVEDVPSNGKTKKHYGVLTTDAKLYKNSSGTAIYVTIKKGTKLEVLSQT